MSATITFSGPPAPAVPIEVVTVLRDTARFDEFSNFPGAYDVIAVQSAGPPCVPSTGSPWWLVSPHGHRVAAVTVITDVTPSGHDDGRFEIHLAVGERDGWLVHPGDGWLLEPTTFPDSDGIEALLLKVTEPSRRRHGTDLLFALDQTWAPLVRGATELIVTEVPGRPIGVVERCLEDRGEGDAPRMVVTVHLAVDPWLNVGAVYRLQPRFGALVRVADAPV